MSTASSLAFPQLDALPWLRYVVTERNPVMPLGGDMSFSTGTSDPESIVANRRHWLAALDTTPEQAVMCGLVHGTAVRRVDAAEGGRGVLSPTTTIEQTDGLITGEPGVTLMMCFADCVPLILVDTERRVIGLAHAGWRGTLAGMAGSVVAAISKEYGSRGDALYGLIGPSIGPDVYTVGEEVVSAFECTHPDDRVIVQDERGTRLDLWEANRQQLLHAGLRPDAIGCADMCTFAHGERFFSHRYAIAHGEREGRFAVLLTMEG